MVEGLARAVPSRAPPYLILGKKSQTIKPSHSSSQRSLVVAIQLRAGEKSLSWHANQPPSLFLVETLASYSDRMLAVPFGVCPLRICNLSYQTCRIPVILFLTKSGMREFISDVVVFNADQIGCVHRVFLGEKSLSSYNSPACID